MNFQLYQSEYIDYEQNTHPPADFVIPQVSKVYCKCAECKLTELQFDAAYQKVQIDAEIDEKNS